MSADRLRLRQQSTHLRDGVCSGNPPRSLGTATSNEGAIHVPLVQHDLQCSMAAQSHPSKLPHTCCSRNGLRALVNVCGLAAAVVQLCVASTAVLTCQASAELTCIVCCSFACSPRCPAVVFGPPDAVATQWPADRRSAEISQVTRSSTSLSLLRCKLRTKARGEGRSSCAALSHVLSEWKQDAGRGGREGWPVVSWSLQLHCYRGQD